MKVGIAKNIYFEVLEGPVGADLVPYRRCMDIESAASYVKRLTNQLRNTNINEISIDPIQDCKSDQLTVKQKLKHDYCST